MSNKLGDLQKSYELADIINKMKPFLNEMDLDYARSAIAHMQEVAGFNDSAAVLNPHYDPAKTDLMYVQCQALSKLVEYVELLKKCDQLKATVGRNNQQRSEILKFFL